MNAALAELFAGRRSRPLARPQAGLSTDKGEETDMDLQLHGKTALVTGGSEGIGKGIALALAKEGVDVAICARRKEPLEKTAAEIAKQTNRKIVAIPADLRSNADAKSFIEQGAQGARSRRHHGQQCRLGGGRRDRASDRGRLGAGPATQVHGLCALPALRLADHGQAGRRPGREPDRQRRGEAVLLGDLPGRGQCRRSEPDAVARRSIRQAQHQLLRRQSRDRCAPSAGPAWWRRCRAT